MFFAGLVSACRGGIGSPADTLDRRAFRLLTLLPAGTWTHNITSVHLRKGEKVYAKCVKK